MQQLHMGTRPRSQGYYLKSKCEHSAHPGQSPFSPDGRVKVAIHDVECTHCGTQWGSYDGIMDQIETRTLTLRVRLRRGA